MEMREGIDRRHVLLGAAVGIAASSLTALAEETRSMEDQRMADENANDEVMKEKIRRACLSGPPSVTNEATVVEMDANGKTVVLRKGQNQWVCMPGNENIIGNVPMS